jgi:hypothetical protein
MVRFAWIHSIAFRNWFTSLAMDLVNGVRVPLGDWLRASNLIPLRKKKGGVRPIAIGEVFVRAICRWALKRVDTEKYMLKEQYGVGSAGGVEPVVCSMDDSIPRAPNGMVFLDLKNGFNSLARRKIAKTVCEEVPVLSKLVRFLYNEHSMLVTVDANGRACTLMSREGVRQGDVLGSFLFSLAVKGLVLLLKEKFALEVEIGATADVGDGKIVRLVWAYLDDLYIALKEGQSLSEVVEFLSSETVRAEWGLAPNAEKCEFHPQASLKSTGAEVLGGWIGGAEDYESVADGLTLKAAARLRERLSTLNSPRLSMQERLLLLRLCYFPVLNHLLRTLPPKVGLDGTAEFDEIVWECVVDWVGDAGLPECAKDIAQSPMRLGGLGFFNQLGVKDVACGSCFVACQGILRERGFPISPEGLDRRREVVKLCADNLNLPVESLLVDEFAMKDMQRRAMEVQHERQWERVFRKLTPSDQARLLENGGPLARGWLHAFPWTPHLAIDDQEMLYVLRRTLLSSFEDCVSRSGRCGRPGCRYTGIDHPMHHLMCGQNGLTRTYRHTALISTLVWALQQGGCPDVVKEQCVGDGRRADVMAVLSAHVREVIEVSVVAVKNPAPGATLQLPSEGEVARRMEEDKAGPRREAFFFWEDFSDEECHPEAVRIRTFRKMAGEVSHGKQIAARVEKKEKHYRDGLVDDIRSFIVSAGGCIAADTHELCKFIVRGHSRLLREQSFFRRWLWARLSIVLLKYASRMCHRTRKTPSVAL